jgi:hypothetical protein
VWHDEDPSIFGLMTYTQFEQRAVLQLFPDISKLNQYLLKSINNCEILFLENYATTKVEYNKNGYSEFTAITNFIFSPGKIPM